MNNIQHLNRNSELFDRISIDLLQAGYPLRFTAQGTSMKPLIRDGDIVLVEPINQKKVKPSEIVLFINNQEKLVLHRVIQKWKIDGKFQYLLKGDQVRSPDGIFEHSKIFGRLVGLERAEKKITINEPIFKLLNWLAFVRSRTNLGRKGKMAKLGKKINCVSKYLR